MHRPVHLFKPLGLSSEAQLTPKVQLESFYSPGSQCCLSEHQPQLCSHCWAGRLCSLCTNLSNRLVVCIHAALWMTPAGTEKHAGDLMRSAASVLLYQQVLKGTCCSCFHCHLVHTSKMLRLLMQRSLGSCS